MKIPFCLLIALTLVVPSISHGQNTAPKPSLEAQLDSIVLPTVEFKKASIISAVNTLRDLARENSKDGKGVNIFLRINDVTPPASVTCILTKPTLRQAITEVARQSGMKVRVDAVAVSLN